MTARRDFLAFTAGAVAARTVLPLAARAEGANPDAALIAACEAHRGLVTAYNEATEDALDSPPEREAYLRCNTIVCDTEPRTMAGILAKARAAIGEADAWGGAAELSAHSDPGHWAWSVVTSLVRLHGG